MRFSNFNFFLVWKKLCKLVLDYLVTFKFIENEDKLTFYIIKNRYLSLFEFGFYEFFPFNHIGFLFKFLLNVDSLLNSFWSAD